MITAKTKALLFSKVDERIRSIYPENPPEIYSLPIVNKDWEQIKFLTRHLERV